MYAAEGQCLDRRQIAAGPSTSAKVGTYAVSRKIDTKSDGCVDVSFDRRHHCGRSQGTQQKTEYETVGKVETLFGATLDVLIGKL